jgi:hypothetical protein
MVGVVAVEVVAVVVDALQSKMVVVVVVVDALQYKAVV